jgi:hypothetical protein
VVCMNYSTLNLAKMFEYIKHICKDVVAKRATKFALRNRLYYPERILPHLKWQPSP